MLNFLLHILIQIKRNWFILSIFVVIGIAKIQPTIGSHDGILYTEVTVKYVAVTLIFFNSGLSLQTEELTKALFNCKIHTFIQCFTFLVYPALMLLLSSTILHHTFEDSSIKGLLVLSCMPPPVSSAVILTKAAKGNEAAAIFNSAFGSLLGIFLTPLLVLYTLGSYGTVPYMSVVEDLSITVLLPLIIAQLMRRFQWVRHCVRRYKMLFGTLSSLVLLFIIYTTFCDTFSHQLEVDVSSVLNLLLFIVILQAILLGLIFHVCSRYLQHVYHSQDLLALMFCSTHKSLTLGIPIIKVLFASDPKISLLSIPLLIYHPTQIVLGSLLVQPLSKWTYRVQLRYNEKSELI